jgi:Tfp pilus assembly protein PilO
MELMSRWQKLSARERAIMALTLALLIFFAPYYFLYSPAAERSRALRDQHEALSTEVQALRRLFKELPPPKAQVARAALRLPQPWSMSQLLGTLSRQASLNDVELLSLTPQDSRAMGRYRAQGLRLQMKARYRAFYEFLRSLQQSRALLSITELQMEAPEATYPYLNISLRATAYLTEGS